MALLGGRAYRRRKKEVLFIDGYNIDNAVDIIPGLDRQDETFHIYGDDSPQTDVQHNYGNLQVTIMDKGAAKANKVLDVLTGINPTSTAPRQYTVDRLETVDAWVNIKDSGNTQYVKSYFVPGWTPGMPLPSGAPNDKAQYSVTGNSELPRQFDGLWIAAKKIASGAAPTLGATPVVVPNEAGVYAIRIKALDLTGGVFVGQEIVPPASTMVSSTGAITMSAIEALVTTLADTTHVYIMYLQSGTGVYPNNAPDGLRV